MSDDRDDDLTPWEEIEREREAAERGGPGETWDVLGKIVALMKNAGDRERQTRADFLGMAKAMAVLVASAGEMLTRMDAVEAENAGLRRRVEDLERRLAGTAAGDTEG